MSSLTVLKRILPNWRLNERELIWLWLELKGQDAVLPIETFGTSAMYSEMEHFLHDKKLVDRLNDWKTTDLVPDHDLEWINKDGRQVQWLLHEFLRFLEKNNLPAPKCPAHLNERGELITLIDHWHGPISEKKRFLERLQNEWDRHAIDDQIYDWFTRGNEKQKCEIAWDWYRKKHPRLMRDRPRFIKLGDLLSCLDFSGFTEEERRFHIGEFQKEFKRQQSKNNLKGKAQTNLALDEQVRDQLDALAEKHGQTLVAVVERLIRHAYQHGIPKGPLETEFKN